MPVKPHWWLDEADAHDAAVIVRVEGVEHRLPGWDAYDVVVKAGSPEMVAWMPRSDGDPGRRVYNLVPVSEGSVGAVVFRPSVLPELAGKLETLEDEIFGRPSLLRMALAAGLIAAVAYGLWRLASG